MIGNKLTEERIKIMQAYADGEIVEIYDKSSVKWAPCCVEPSWNWAIYLYRIKVVPPVSRESLISDIMECVKNAANIHLAQYHRLVTDSETVWDGKEFSETP